MLTMRWKKTKKNQPTGRVKMNIDSPEFKFILEIKVTDPHWRNKVNWDRIEDTVKEYIENYVWYSYGIHPCESELKVLSIERTGDNLGAIKRDAEQKLEEKRQRLAQTDKMLEKMKEKRDEMFPEYELEDSRYEGET